MGGFLASAVSAAPIFPEAPVRPMAPLVKATTKEILAKLDSITARVLDSIDDETIAKSGLRDRMIAAGVAIDKRQLLSGQPTQILSIDERKSLNALVPALLREAQRRGIAPEIIDVTPGAP